MQLIKVEIPKMPDFSISEEQEQSRNDLILQSKEIKAVTDAITQNSAVDAARSIRTHIKEVESTRTSLTKPLLDAQRALKALADDYCTPLVDEQRRVERMVTDFQASEARRVAAEEQARREAIAKLEQERLEAEQQAREAASKMTSEEELESALKREAEAKEAALQAHAAIVAPLPEAQKARGASTRKVMRYEVLNVHHLYKARPDLCKLEAKPSAILATCVPETPVPGLKLWWDSATSIRSY